MEIENVYFYHVVKKENIQLCYTNQYEMCNYKSRIKFLKHLYKNSEGRIFMIFVEKENGKEFEIKIQFWKSNKFPPIGRVLNTKRSVYLIDCENLSVLYNIKWRNLEELKYQF